MGEAAVSCAGGCNVFSRNVFGEDRCVYCLTPRGAQSRAVRVSPIVGIGGSVSVEVGKTARVFDRETSLVLNVVLVSSRSLYGALLMEPSIVRRFRV
jgi:hypothetical protein